MNKILKIIFLIFITLLLIIYIIFSYFGFFFFSKGFNNLDCLLLEILGNSILVSIATYISTKSISTLISLKEFKRRNKINISINEKNNMILSYKKFINEFENSNTFFGLEKEHKELLEYIYKKYTFIINTFNTTEDKKESNMIEVILNLPFNKFNFDDDDLTDSYTGIFKQFGKDERFNNICILNNLLSKEDYKKLNQISSIVQNIKHFEITNLNSSEGIQILVTANEKVINKISCLPNNKYDFYVYLSEDSWIQFIAFSYDYDGKEEATFLQGFKYSNKNENNDPIRIDLLNYIKVH